MVNPEFSSVFCTVVKSGLSVPKGTFAKLERIIPDERVVARAVLYLGDQVLKSTTGNYLLPISSLWTHSLRSSAFFV